MKGTDCLVGGVKELSSNWQTMYDFFKHLTTLSLGAILFISAFLRFDNASVLQEVSIAFSVLAFLVSIWTSLGVMTRLGDMMLYYSGIQALTTFTDILDKDDKKDQIKVSELVAKIGELEGKIDNKELELRKWIKITQRSFLTGGIFSGIFILYPIIEKLLGAIGRNSPLL